MQKIICYFFGHKLIVLTRINNNCSQFGHAICSRCGHVENYQYDF
jgi:hypothetical protein